MRRYQRKRVNVTERFGVSAYFPTEQMQTIAHERTEGIVGAFLTTPLPDFSRYQQALETLARSCYMQGLNDMTDAVAKRFTLTEKSAAPKGETDGR